DDRLLRRGAAEELQGGVEEPEAGFLGIGCGGPRGVCDEVVAERFERLYPGPVRRRSSSLPATPPYDLRAARLRDRAQLVCQAGLADTRLAGDQREPVLPGQRLLEQVLQRAELAVVPD